VEHLLSGLKGAGLITSSPGSHGGYVLAVKPSDINIATVMDAVGDNSLDPACSGTRDSFCLGSACGLSQVFNKLSKDLRKVLTSYTLDDFYYSYSKQTSKGKK
jgi:Rrf2 family protein